MTDRQLPQAVNAEQAIIGTCFVQPEAIHDIMSILTPEMFYLESNKQLYTAIIDVTKKNGNSDLIFSRVFLSARQSPAFRNKRKCPCALSIPLFMAS